MKKKAHIPLDINKISSLLSSWSSGDLIGISQIEAAFQSLDARPELKALSQEGLDAFKAILRSVRDLLQADSGESWIKQAKLWLESQADALKQGGLREAEKGAEEDVAEESGESLDPKEIYEEGYFSNIIEDKKMLGQLCDEVREHLEIAQFTLVDLEYDASNPENINKIFRAFHTIKSSAAFLGFKNLEETAHAMEDLLVMVRDGKIGVSPELIDVVFYGIGLLRDLVLIIETSGGIVASMVESFKRVDIRPYIAVIKKILTDYKTKKIGEILQEDGKLDEATVDSILSKQQATKKKFGEIAVEDKHVSEEDFRAALHKQSAAVHKASYVKVSNDRLNALIDIVGELVVNQSMIRQYILDPEAARETAERTISQLESITTNIKNLVLSMGMVPISEIFNKLRVVVRNTAAETGKTVVVDFSGDDTELDRNVIESIYDPLVHIVRNAVDHGLESPDAREASGKSRMGRIRIAAEHKGSGIEISVGDDGLGINRDKVLAKAVKQGLIGEDAAMALTEKDVFSLLFLPGFSTAERVTEVSGRGVGLDVVRKNIEQIHGKVEVISEFGRGSEFLIRIPLTLAIIDGFVTLVEGTKYIFPFNLIEEIIVPEKALLSHLESGHWMLLNRGSYIPIVVAREIFDKTARLTVREAGAALDAALIIIIGYEGKRYGIAVDSIIGKQEIVIKSLNEALYRMRVFSGGTIFGDGSIGFVVDVEEFIECAREGE